MKDWHQDLISKLLKCPIIETRLGPAYITIGETIKLDLEYFPATTAKKLFYKSAAKELYLFLNNKLSQKDFDEHNLNIWNNDLEKRNRTNLGKIYGYQWRKWNGYYDQLREAINLIKKDPNSRRAIVNSWNITDIIEDSVLPPCHILFQLNTVNDRLFMSVYQRSADTFLGLPFDIAEFALLTKLICNELNIKLATMVYHISNLHLYLNHIDSAKELISLEANEYPLLELNDTIDNYHYNNVVLSNYKYSKKINVKLNT